VLPIVILPRVSPLLDQVEPLKPRQLLGVAPSGLVGCFGSGVAIAGIYALLPLYLQRIGLEVGEVGNMMAWVILGAMLLQYPVGRWSDRKDRQDVLIALAAMCTVLSLLTVFLPGLVLLPALLFLLGGGVFTLYPVAVSQRCRPRAVRCAGADDPGPAADQLAGLGHGAADHFADDDLVRRSRAVLGPP
jgi:hypothetical protein